ncbi:MAG: hypothetical protein M1829_003102 [Trizodia sp. TS-e1964]|nr:MAG: hypothetical protein M1829_003102 [Trizodia sp. TS-e1964]
MPNNYQLPQNSLGPQTGGLRYADVGINFTDPVFQGIYHGSQRHEDDLQDVIQRAREAGCEKFLVTGSDLVESRAAIDLARQHRKFISPLFHWYPPAKIFDTFSPSASALLAELEKTALEGKAAGLAVAFGEIGLDYDRLYLTPKAQQLKYFELQLDVAVRVQMPLFLHSRAASEDFERLLMQRLENLPRRGLVHSFTGSVAEMQRLVEMGFDIGVNGCSMKTEDNLAVVREIPLEKLQIETDGPWCEMRPSHASAQYLAGAPPLPKSAKKEKFVKGLMVKGRNEPATIPHVAFAIANIKGVAVQVVCDAAWNNSVRMFGLGEGSN